MFGLGILELILIIVLIVAGIAVGRALAIGLKEDQRKIVGGIALLIGGSLVIYGIATSEVWGAITTSMAAIDFGVLVAVAGMVVIGSKGSSRGAAEAPSTKKCPFCAETIHTEAKFCSFCGRALEMSASN